MRSVVVVLLSWNNKQAVIDCLARLSTLTGAHVHVVVIDNASSDGSVAAIAHAYPDVTLLQEPLNRGFVGGVNRGLAEAARRGADFAWLINDDTQFDDDVLVPLLARAASDPRAGLLTPLLRNLPPDGGEQFRNGLVDWKRGAMSHNFTDSVHAERAREGATPIVVGTALLVDLRVFRAIGPFDERFFAYWEDTDYSVRAARAGFDNVIVENAIVAHAAPLVTTRPPHYHYYMIRNEALFWHKHWHGPGSLRWKRRWLTAAMASIARNRDQARTENVAAGVDGLWHGWLRRAGARNAHATAPRWFHRLATAAPWLCVKFLERSWRNPPRRG